jgi:hypothetical protein
LHEVANGAEDPAGTTIPEGHAVQPITLFPHWLPEQGVKHAEMLAERTAEDMPAGQEVQEPVVAST